ncbi:MAG: hypothetical protein LC754_05445, partial [Acidobacteria bacterium]|nr:hypothetical protein [Acidobacteriota bacterium]
MLDAVRTQTATAGDSLLVWDSFPRDHPAWHGVADILRQEALRRALRKGADWKTEYLLYGRDPGGVELHASGFDPEGAPMLVKLYRDEVRAQGAHAEAAAEWLTHLADSSLRREVSVNDKIKVAELVGGKWQLLLRLWQLYRGRKNTYDLTEQSVLSLNSSLERRVLRNELSQMTKETPALDFIPDLRGLVEFIDELPEDAVEYFSRLRPRLSSKNYETWIGGWKALKMQGRAEDETARLILEGDEPVRDGWLFRGFSDQKLDNIFHRLLFGKTSQDGERCRAKFEQLLGQQGDRPKLKESVRRVFHAGQSESDGEAIRVFLRRFAWHAAPLDRLFRCLTAKRQDMVVEDFAMFDDDAFSDEVYNIYAAALKRDAPITTYERAMLRYLNKPRGKGIKRMIARSAHFSLSTKGVDEHLEEILSRPTVPLPGDAEEEPEAAIEVADENVSVEDEHAGDAGGKRAEASKSRASVKSSPSPAHDDSPSLFGKLWGFAKSLLTQPELDSDDSDAS